jgi:DNA excision repair protein ERCC-2
MDAPAAQFTVAVRTLCEFTAKQGDLDLRFTPAPTAMQGMVGHLEVTGNRDSQHYQREVTLCGSYQQLRVRGRADGYDERLNRLEEIKTHRGRLERMPANHRVLHWAQAKVYGWLMCQQMEQREMDIALVYYDITRQRETVLCEHYQAEELRAFFEGLCQRFLAWARQELAHREARNAQLTTLAFPHAEFRAGQRTLAENVYKANLSGRCLMAQAPTGIGKTVGTLFPLLKATPGQQLDKLVFLTAKTTGRQLALDAMQRISGASAAGRPRVLELVARDKACEHPDKACHGESCPLAQGFYDRLPQAREAALGLPAWDKPAMRQLAAQHAVCPYYLTQELLRWSDVVVGDYNHFFDVTALVHGQALQEGWRVSLLVDEAHNLVERARKMYTTELDQRALQAMREEAPAVLKPAFTRVQRAWASLVADQEEAYQVYPELPQKLLQALQKLTGDIADYMAEHPTRQDNQLLGFYFDTLHFQWLAELHGPQSLFDITRHNSGDAPPLTTLCLRNVVPAPMLKQRWAAAHSATLFSATLNPPQYLHDMLGLPQDTARVDVASPFDASQLQVRVARHISTRYSDRADSLAALVELMAAQYARQPGNYLAFFSSYDYLQMAASQMQACYPQTPLWLQERSMGEAQRGEFLARFTPDSSGIGLAVLGGPFAEGIDLPGTRLIGAFIATLGMPQVNAVNEQIKQCVQANLGQGHDYTYLVPGLQKVVQAAGRVIRTPQDTGVLWLMDDRFARPEVSRLLPAWWQPEVVDGRAIASTA